MNPKIKSSKDILKEIINSFKDVILRSQIDLNFLIAKMEQSPNITHDVSADVKQIETHQKQTLEKINIAKKMLEKEYIEDYLIDKKKKKKKKKVNIS